MFDEMITMQILTKLLVTNMVANNLSTSAKSDRIWLSRASAFSRICCNSLGVREKKATSEPDTKAEIKSRINITTPIMAISGVKPKYVIANSSKRN